MSNQLAAFIAGLTIGAVVGGFLTLYLLVRGWGEDEDEGS